MSRTQRNNKDFLLMMILAIIAVVGFWINHQIQKQPAACVEVSVDGTVVMTLDLHQDTDQIITGYNGGTNRLVIAQDTVRILEASCPDHLCVHQGAIEKAGEPLVCLPNRVVVQIISTKR